MKTDCFLASNWCVCLNECHLWDLPFSDLFCFFKNQMIKITERAGRFFPEQFATAILLGQITFTYHVQHNSESTQVWTAAVIISININTKAALGLSSIWCMIFFKEISDKSENILNCPKFTAAWSLPQYMSGMYIWHTCLTCIAYRWHAIHISMYT